MRGFLAVALLVLAACSQQTAPPERVKLNRTGGTTFELIPGEKQYPYCLAFTVASNGTIRQLTMAKDNKSFQCPAGKPVGGTSYKVPGTEGAVQVHVLFTSQRVPAASVARQIVELSASQSLHPLNLRLPGEASLVSLEFTPEAEVAPVEGAVVELDGGNGVPSAADAGSAPATADGG